MVQPEVIVVPAVFVIPGLVIFFRMWFKHKEKMAELTGAASRNPMHEARLQRIEEAVETIAIEMERMGEGQRFVTKLLSDRAALAEGHTATAGERVKTPSK
jgi:hypothetical protein